MKSWPRNIGRKVMRPMPDPTQPQSGGQLYVPEMSSIVQARNLTAQDRLFEIELPEERDLGHKPGQFVQLSIFGFGEAPISVCSAPARKGSFELCVRKVGSLTAALHALGAGDAVGIRGPFGNGFPMECLTKMDVLIIAGGIGLAPLRSVIKQILSRRKRYGRLIILYGAKEPGDILFVNEIAAWRADKRNEVLVTVDQPTEDWDGPVGVVTTLIPEVEIDPSQTVVVALVGPPVMYKFVYLELKDIGIPDDQMFFSLERRMKCGVGKCGHCQIDGYCVCVDGPVFSAKQVKQIHESL